MDRHWVDDVIDGFEFAAQVAGACAVFIVGLVSVAVLFLVIAS